MKATHVKKRNFKEEKMKREYLEKLGLEKETIDKIMAENGKDIEAEKSKIEAEKSKIEAKEKELETIRENLTKANETIESYKEMNIDEIKASADDWKTKYEGMEQELTNVKNNARLEKEIAGFNTIDSDVLLKLINQEDLVYKDDKIHGLEDQITKIKESKSYLFQEEKQESDSEDRFLNYDPETSSGSTNTMTEELNNIFGD